MQYRRRPPVRHSALALAVLALGAAAQAAPIDTGNPDLELRWDNSLRYNLGVRAQRQDQAILNNVQYDDSDGKFKRGDVVLNRLDVLTEADLAYRKSHGLRLSGALWADQAYHDARARPNAAYTVPGLGNLSSAYANDEYSHHTKRWNRGPSGELLDAFAYTRFELGEVPVNVKLGRHTIYWGESLFSFVHGVSFAQGPIDIRKALSNPGVEAKEIFKPLPQLSATAQLSDTLSVAGQYYLGWQASSFPDGGTYFGVLDALSQGGGTYLVNPALALATSAQYSQLVGAPVQVSPVPFVPSYGNPRKRGDWGLMARWSPAWLDGTAGAYYRRYTDKLPSIVLAGLQPSTLPFAPAGVLPQSFGLSYPDQRATLIGASLSKQVAGVSVGAEVAHRGNTRLLMGPATFLGAEPVGDTWHALLNAIAFIGKTPVFDSAVLTTELTYSRLDKVKRNPLNYNAVGYGCVATAQLGCATRDAWGLAVKFEPKWFQVFPGADLSMPVTVVGGVKGTSPVLFGGYEGNVSYSAGLALDLAAKYNVALSYNGSAAKHTELNGPAALGGLRQVDSIGGIGAQWDRGWVSLTVKATF